MIGIYRKFTLDHVLTAVFSRSQTGIEIRKFHKIYLKNLERGERDSHMKQKGMLVVSLRSVNFGFHSRLGCSRQSANILNCQGLV